MFAINYDNGYISGVVAGVGADISNCTEEEYQAVREMLLHPPDAPEGCNYRLRADLNWELVAQAAVPEMATEANEGDYIAALQKMGVEL